MPFLRDKGPHRGDEEQGEGPCRGTTVARTLESFASESGVVEAGQRSTELFIYPGYEYRIVDGPHHELPPSEKLFSHARSRFRRVRPHHESLQRGTGFGVPLLLLRRRHGDPVGTTAKRKE